MCMSTFDCVRLRSECGCLIRSYAFMFFELKVLIYRYYIYRRTSS